MWTYHETNYTWTGIATSLSRCLGSIILSSSQEFSKFLFSLIANDRQTQPFINTNTRIDCVDRKSSLRLAFDRLSERHFAPWRVWHAGWPAGMREEGSVTPRLHTTLRLTRAGPWSSSPVRRIWCSKEVFGFLRACAECDTDCIFNFFLLEWH